MIKEILFKQFSKFFQHEMNVERGSIAYQTRVIVEQERKQSRIECDRITFDLCVGKPMIILTNEWNNPIIGELIRLEGVEKGTWYVMYDYLTKTEQVCLVRPFEFSMQKLKILGKLTPDEICALFYEGRSHHGTFRKHPTYGRINPEQFTGYADWMERLMKNGFWEKFGDILFEAEQESNLNWIELEKKYGKV